MNRWTQVIAVALAAAMVMVMGCAGTSRQQAGTGAGAAIGAGLGALAGQAIGGDQQAAWWGAAIGAAVGGLAGNQIGAYMDRQERELEDALAATNAAIQQQRADTNAALQQQEAASLQRDQDVLTATFRSEVLFDYDSATLKPGAYTEIARVADVLNRFPQTAIQVEGHTDAAGSEQYNLELSQRRAQSVVNALAQRGVDPRRMRAVGYGETQPVSSLDALNRRVNIVITPIVAQG